jgi:formylglycine-generating enzyme required for sulfatase activity
MVNSIGMKLVRIPAGKFRMGSPLSEVGRIPNEHPHDVEITRPFWIGMYEVTQGEYQRVMNENPSGFTAPGDSGLRLPVHGVSWHDATTYCERLSELAEEKKQGRLYRLPTEAEWEYACRGGATTSVPFGVGDGLSLSSAQANFNGTHPYGDAEQGEYLKRPCEVGSYKPNAFGLYDMHGNVWEWCRDWYGNYGATAYRDPEGSPDPKENNKVYRGGSWRAEGAMCRSALRFKNTPEYASEVVGLRVVCIVTSR